MNSNQNPAGKILQWDNLERWRNSLGPVPRVVVTNGCFDLLHPGHADILHRARDLGDILLVGVNSDDSVRRLKGESRPLLRAEHRAFMLAALESVDRVVIFNQLSACDLLKAARASIWVKGGDYALETLNPEEVRIARSIGTKIQLLSSAAWRYSTTALVNQIKSGSAASGSAPA